MIYTNKLDNFECFISLKDAVQAYDFYHQNM